MFVEKMNPAAVVRAGSEKSVALRQATCLTTTPNAGESLAVAIMANRYRLTIPTARAVCELAGIGRAWL